MMKKEIKPVKNLPTKRALTNYQFGDICYEYLDKITELCKKNNIELILTKAPSIYPYWYEEYDKQLQEYAEKNNVEYINLLNYVEEIGIDYTQDTYDSGMHLNLYGAKKLSAFFAEFLKNNYSLIDFRKNNDVNKIYEKKLLIYHNAENN